MKIPLRLDRSSSTRKSIIYSFNVIVVLITSVFPFRFFFRESVIGEPFDTKAQLVFHEHWFDFLNGIRDFLDAGFFYPYKFSFALSDLFLISGPIHALFRFIGFDLLDSFQLATLLIVFLSNVGWLLLANKIINNQIFRYLFVLTVGMSYTYIGHIYEKPNIASYGLISWFFLNIVLITRYKNQSSLKTTNAFGSIMIIPLILALNVWYVAYYIFLFSTLTTIIFLFIITFTKNLKPLYKTIVKFISYLDLKILILWIILFLTCIWCILIIYLPQSSSDYNEVNKDFFLNYSPNILSFFDTSGSGGGFITNLFKFLYVKNGFSPEMNLGIHPVIFILFFLIIFLILKRSRESKKMFNLFILSGALGNIIITISFIKIQSNNSIFFLIWENLSPLRTMRIPIRANIIIIFIALIYIFYYADQLYINKKVQGKTLTYLILIPLLFDMLRTPNLYWEKPDLIDNNLISYKQQLTKCNSFILDREEVSWWKDSIDGLILSTILKIPTVNGFSSIYPRDYPRINWNESSDLEGILKWLKKENGISKTCLITHGEEVIRLDKNPVFWSAQQGFTRREFKNKNSWNWMVNSKGNIMLFNLTSNIKKINVSFKVKSSWCNYGQEVIISTKDESIISQQVLGNKPLPISIDLKLESFESLFIKIQTNGKSCTVDADPRNLFLSVNDVSLTEL